MHAPQAKGVDGFVLDLRSNPGGLVQSAAEVARVFMDGSPTLFTVSGRSGEQLQEVALEVGAWRGVCGAARASCCAAPGPHTEHAVSPLQSLPLSTTVRRSLPKPHRSHSQGTHARMHAPLYPRPSRRVSALRARRWRCWWTTAAPAPARS